MYFSDVYADRRVPQALVAQRIALWRVPQRCAVLERFYQYSKTQRLRRPTVSGRPAARHRQRSDQESSLGQSTFIQPPIAYSK